MERSIKPIVLKEHTLSENTHIMSMICEGAGESSLRDKMSASYDSSFPLKPSLVL